MWTCPVKTRGFVFAWNFRTMRMKRPNRDLRWPSLALLLTLGSLHCGAMDEDAAMGAPRDCAGTGCDEPGGTGGSGGGDQGDVPEDELESGFEVPVVTEKRVWAANPESGRVAIVDASTLEIRIVDAGFGPTHLAAIPSRKEGEEQAIVLNVHSHDATLIRIDTAGQLETATVPVHEGANAWSISPHGRFAIAWTNARHVPDADPTEGFQDLTVIDLASSPPKATRLAVGYRPAQVVIDENETRAFAVTEPGISVIALDGETPELSDLVELTSSGPTSVDITPDGSLALVRREGSQVMTLVNLVTSARADVTLSGPVTDLDLSLDGSFALAVIRTPTHPEEEESPQGSQVVVLPLPDAFDDANAVTTVTIPNETFGSASLTQAGDVALLYTNAIPSDRLVVLSLASMDHRTLSLKAPIKAVLPAPDSEHAVAVLQPPPGSTKPGAFALVPTKNTLPPRIQGTEAPVLGVSISPAPSHRALVVTRGGVGQEHAAYLARLPQLQVDRIRLASPPLALGMAPAANVAFVAQEHPEGRLTFIDLDGGAARTVTGFELGTRVVD